MNFSFLRALALYKADLLYHSRFKRFGAEHKGVHWSSSQEQKRRFEILCSILAGKTTLPDLKIADLGCGYGALYSHLQSNGFIGQYYGYDRCRSMLSHARKQFPFKNAHFIKSSKVCEPVHFTIISGCFNLKMNATDEVWWAWVREILSNSWARSTHGVAFNVLIRTRSSRPLNKLFYTSKKRVMEECTHFTKNIECIPSSELPDAHFLLYKTKGSV
ncbi:MAG: hypothetical protein CMK59_14665 [Proteobacteria bacterium]|nr:hypothetical protein [Pseudomonadota bacterium]